MKKTKEEKYKINKTKTCFFKKFPKAFKNLIKVWLLSGNNAYI